MKKRSILLCFLFCPLSAASLADYSFAIALRERGESKRACEFFQKAYEADPLSIHLVRIIADQKRKEGKELEAQKVYEKSIKPRNEDVDLLLEYGNFLEAAVDSSEKFYSMKMELYEKASRLRPGSLRPIEHIIRLARDRGDDELARKTLERLELDTEQSILYFIASTKSLYSADEIEASKRIEAQFLKSIDQHPDWGNLARIASDYFREKKFLDQAIRILEQHVEASPSSLDLRIRLGILYFAGQRDLDGIRALEAVIEIHPQMSLAHESLSKLYRKKSMSQQARYHAAEVLRIRSGSSDEFIELATELYDAKEFRQARILLEKAIFRYPDDLQLWIVFAKTSAEDPESRSKAIWRFQEAEKLSQDQSIQDPSFLVAYSEALKRVGDTRSAEEKLRGAIRLFPKDAKLEAAQAMKALAEIWISEKRNLEAADALLKRAQGLER